MTTIPLSKPNIPEAGIALAAETIRSGALVHGAHANAFEAALAGYLGCADVVVVSSGTAALHLAMMALDLGPGDAVLVPDFTFPATANAVAMVGAEPVLVDVDPATYAMSAAALEKAIRGYNGSGRLRAIMPVHEFGLAADMPRIRSLARANGLHVVEDAACALGAMLGSERIGGAATFMSCFSFHPRKTLTTGEGGAVSVNDAALAARLRRLRNHGMERTPEGARTFVEASTNYRLTDFQAALGLSQLPFLDGWIETRARLAARYHARLAATAARTGLRLPALAQGHSWQTFMVVLPAGVDRDAVARDLARAGIEAGAGAQCLSGIGIYGSAATIDGVSNAAGLAAQGLAIPMFENLTDGQVETVCSALEAALDNAFASC